MFIVPPGKLSLPVLEGQANKKTHERHVFLFDASLRRDDPVPDAPCAPALRAVSKSVVVSVAGVGNAVIAGAG